MPEELYEAIKQGKGFYKLYEENKQKLDDVFNSFFMADKEILVSIGTTRIDSSKEIPPLP
eukprot:CAMPEP_0168350824 /NCGR_PEP_ID=MMETSP0213-20121227/21418_1 /TAXON_ID=151035 /ORGANISM="Euplotes harpa, Strain FSP1.4" /LENGTH=59 /DNA_ID=CAMNT_0008361383 /DNA_START=150 /DNA_END=329 /DNA_ORIENTATION=+